MNTYQALYINIVFFGRRVNKRDIFPAVMDPLQLLEDANIKQQRLQRPECSQRKLHRTKRASEKEAQVAWSGAGPVGKASQGRCDICTETQRMDRN